MPGRAHAGRQAALADLCASALRGAPLGELLEEAAACAARELGADHVEVFQDTGDGAGPAAGGLSVPIEVRGRRFGAIEARGVEPGRFSDEDAGFLRALAGLLGAAAERAGSDELVRDSEARFRELADTTPALMWMTDGEGDVTFVNQGWLRFTGGDPETELGSGFAASAHPDDRDELMRCWREACERREEFRCEYRLRHAESGSYRWVVDVGTPRLADGEFVGYVGTATDIHERRAAEDALRASEASFRELADTAPAMIWTTDERGLITFVNEGWLRFTGTSFQEELGPTMLLGVHAADTELVLSSWEDALRERRPWEREYRLRNSVGEYRWVSDRAVPRYVGDRFAGYVGTAIDIHERKLMEGRLLEVYKREHKIAETLQRSLLPERLPRIEGLELAARYLPGARGAAIGGDWYDVLERPDGRIALVVGDVVGHGLRAAASMGQLRNAFRAYGMVEASPAEVLARINRLVMSGVEQLMATVLYLVLDRETGELTFSSAGHPPPLALGNGRAAFLEGGRSVPIGAVDAALFQDADARLEPGAALLLYTDGLVERRDVPLDRRLDSLAEAASGAPGDPGGICDQVIGAILGDADPGDDVALLAVRPLPTAADRIALTLPAEPGSLAALRRSLARFLHAKGASQLESYEVTLTICEAAGNAIEHAYGPEDASFDLEVAIEGDELVASVRDRGRWRERRGVHRGRGLGIIEQLMDEVSFERDEGGTLVKMRRRFPAGEAG